MTSAEPILGRPALSIVVAVYGVAPYLRQCLDSILIEAGPDVEVVAVDDASPDDCPSILDAYARAHPALNVLHLPANVGLGGARNAGLDKAAGHYVWFVDGDDRLPAGAVPAVLAALRSTQPDVLLFDHEQLFDDSRVRPGGGGPLLRRATCVGPLAHHPDLLDVPQAAWNRVVRRDFLLELGLRFFPGWYEDVPFSHPVVIAASRVAALDRVCYHYRQRPTGAITRTVSDRHFDALAQYERLFTAVGASPYRGRLFRLTVDHLLVIAGHDGRLPPARRAEFFRAAAALYQRHLPPEGYPRPSGVAGLKHRLIAADLYAPYAALRAAYRLISGLRQVPRPSVRPRWATRIFPDAYGYDAGWQGFGRDRAARPGAGRRDSSTGCGGDPGATRVLFVAGCHESAASDVEALPKEFWAH